MGLIERYAQEKLNKVLKFLQTGTHRDDIANGKLSQGCKKTNDGAFSIQGIQVAQLYKRLGCWVMSDNIIGVNLSPDKLPIINGMPTISAQQYKYMYAYVQPRFEEMKLQDKMYQSLRPFMEGFEETTDVKSIRFPTQEELKKEDERIMKIVMERYNAIPASAMDTLKKMDRNPTETDIQSYCRVSGDNREYTGGEQIPVSMDDLMVCTFGRKVTRMQELEAENNQENVDRKTKDTSREDDLDER